ncbi:otoferlin-like [Oratosquilla oratoria]|uniref:otoferlin-like n=1 Tax=Oratosquilla oratoria TaxID=337810 RepID=UPI003F76B95D
MSLKIHIKHFTRVATKGDKVAKVTFRGVSQLTRVLEDQGEEAIFDEVLEWPVARHLEAHEVVEVHLQVFSKYFNNRTAAAYGFVLQRLVTEGGVAVTDHMTDANNKLLRGIKEVSLIMLLETERICCDESYAVSSVAMFEVQMWEKNSAVR